MKEKKEQKIGYIFILSLLKNSVKFQSFLRANEKEMGTFFCPRSSEEFSEYQSFVRANNRKERVRQRGWLQCSGSTRCS
jgi:hypothetical protein